MRGPGLGIRGSGLGVRDSGFARLRFAREVARSFRLRGLSEADAKSYIFGITAGNDVSERDWQQADLQWFRAKAADTFGPLGPVIVQGLNYNDLLLQTRVNGQVVQSARTKVLIFGVDKIVSCTRRTRFRPARGRSAD